MTDPNKIFDGLLVLQYRAGTKKALNVLVHKYHAKLCKHSYGFTHDIDASKDIVQDSWGKIIGKIDNLKDPNHFGSWAFRIVTRKSLDFVNQRKRELGNLHDYYKDKSTVDSADIRETEVHELLKAICDLTNEQQQVLRLFYTQNYTLNEISEILNLSVGTVKSRLFHAERN